MDINKNTTLGEIINNFENAEDILKGFGMHCFYCPMSQMETLEEASEVHGIELGFLLEKLKKELKPKKDIKK